MLSDEEMKALKIVNKRTERLIEELKIEEEDLIDEPKIAYLITQIEANKTLVNLIEKQQKEIEILNKNMNLLREQNISYKQSIHGLKEMNKKWEDKIKAKIEELERQEKEEPDAFLCKKVLQSLLEEK